MGQLFDRIKTPFRKRKPPMLMQRGFFMLKNISYMATH